MTQKLNIKPRFNYFKSPDIDNHKGRHILFYCEWGNPKSTDIVMCVHGLSRNSRDFDYIAADLAINGSRVICVDVVGRGKSEWLSDKSQYDYETYVTDVIKLIDHLGIKQLSWIGTSMGGIIGMIVASRYPHIIKKLVLNDIGPVIPGKAIERILRNVNSASEFHNKLDAEKALRAKMATFGIKKEEHWKHLLQYSVIRKLNGKYTFSYDPSIVPAPNFANKLKSVFKKIVPVGRRSVMPDVNLIDIWDKIFCPILVLRGKISDVLTAEIAQAMKTSKPNIEIIEFEEIGHAPALMEDEQIEPVRKWLLGN